MGVQKLRKCLKVFSSSGYQFEEKVNSDATLLIDTPGFIFEILNHTLEDAQIRVGGDFALLDRLTKNVLDDLARKMRFKLIFFLDGDTEDFYYEGDVTENKLKSGNDGWDNLRNYLANPRSVEDKVQISKSPCGWDQVVCAIKDYKLNHPDLAIDIIQCKGDSDIFIGRKNRELITSGHRNVYVLANDTDFAMMPDCKLILIDDEVNSSMFFNVSNTQLSSVFAAAEASATAEGINAAVLSKTKLAEAFRLTEEQIVHLGILLGTDYTKRFKRADYDISSGQSTGRGYGGGRGGGGSRGGVIFDGFNEKALQMVYNAIKNNPSRTPRCLRSSRNQDLQASIDYSYALYYLDDNFEAVYHLDKYRNVNNLERVCGESCPFSLSNMQKDFALEITEAYLEDLVADSDAVEEETADQALTIDVLTIVQLILSINQQSSETSLFPQITSVANSIYYDSFMQLIDILNRKVPPPAAQTLRFEPAGISYEDICATAAYQNIAKKVVKVVNDKLQSDQFRDYADTHGAVIVINSMPRQFYNGKLFHVLLQQQRHQRVRG